MILVSHKIYILSKLICSVIDIGLAEKQAIIMKIYPLHNMFSLGGYAMKLQERKQVKVKGKAFGGDKLLECIPIVSKNREELVRDFKEVTSHQPDVVEWRIDWLDRPDDLDYVVGALCEVAPLVKDIPLLLTFRHISEGGYKEESQQTRLNVIRAACETGLIDLVDVESANESSFIEEVKRIVKASNVKLVLSNHNFKQTPPENEIVASLKHSKEQGADIAKIAVMPTCFSDVVTLAKATYRARSGEVDIPLITVSMGEMGSVTRVMGREIGSDLSFLCSAGASGPGQINIEDYRLLKSIIYNEL